MTPQEICVALRKLSVPMADAYRSITNLDPKRAITDAEMQRLYKLVYDPDNKDNLIDERDADALIILIDNAKFAEDVLDNLGGLIQADPSGLIAGTGRRLTTATELQEVKSALSLMSSQKFSFWSPGSKITYTPNLYVVVGDLIDQQKIEIIEVKDHGLMRRTGGKGVYNFEKNTLTLFEEPAVERANTIVHECTHAIQDWYSDKTYNNNMLEADGFIAGAIIDIVNGRPAATGADASTMAYKAAKDFVLTGQATEFVVKNGSRVENSAWGRSYNTVKRWLALNGYNPDDQSAQEKNPGKELKVFNDILKALNKKTKAPAGAKP